MRLQLPFRIPFKPALAVIVAVACVQLLEGTHIVFTLLFFGFSLMALIAFNVAEGFATFPGVYVFFFSTLTLLVGAWWKLFLVEPADSNLRDPQLLMAVYTVSMALLLAVVVLNRRIAFRAVAIERLFPTADLNYSIAALGAFAFGMVLLVLLNTLPPQAESALHTISQLNVPFLVLAMLFGTIGVIRESGGRRSVGFINLAPALVAFALGLTTFSKQALLTPGACWIAAAAYTRLKLRRVHYVGLAGFAAFTLLFTNTWAGGRNDVPPNGASFMQRLTLVSYDLQHFMDMRQKEAATNEYYKETGTVTYFDTSQGLMDRLTMFSPDDSLISWSRRVRFEGYLPVIQDFQNWIPHFLAPNKPLPIGGNSYAHEVGGLSPDDTSTGVSFSPVAEAFHLDGWTSTLLLLPAIWFLLFLSIDLTGSGDLRRGPWALILIVYFAHGAPESLLGGLIYYIFNGNIAMLAAMFFATRIAPMLGVFLYGRQKMEAPRPLVLSPPVVRPGAAPLRASGGGHRPA